jgi:ABC-type dipeptide/oligopeptide/nickel transport system permease component
MQVYILKRFLQTIVVIIGVSIIAFGLMFLTGDPAEILLGQGADSMSIDEINAYRHLKGFDRPWYIQYLDFASKAIHGDFGDSYRFHRPAWDVVMERLPATLQLDGFALVLSVVLAIPVGIISATKPNTIADHVTTLASLVGQSVPNFWLGIILMIIFAVNLKWLPVSGMGSWRNLIMPGITLSVFSLAQNMRLTRSTLLEFIHADFVRTARAKGLKESAILFRHAFRNALLPLVTVVGLQVGYLLGGSVIIETIFAWPGVGRLIYMSITGKDFPVVQAGVIMLAVSTTLANLLVDLVYGFLDPRIRYD